MRSETSTKGRRSTWRGARPFSVRIGQVDSAIGGKTAVDLPQGKNLLGSFYQPKAVFADVRFLDTLPEKEFNNGLAEIIKYGAIEDDGLFKSLEDGIEALKNKDGKLLLKTVEACCRIKKNIVEMDEHEQKSPCTEFVGVRLRGRASRR